MFGLMNASLHADALPKPEGESWRVVGLAEVSVRWWTCTMRNSIFLTNEERPLLHRVEDDVRTGVKRRPA